MATSDQHLIEVYRRANEPKLAAELSATLRGYLRKRGVISLTDFQDNPVVDFTRYKTSLTSSAFYLGIDYLASIVEKIIFPAVSDNTTGQQTALQNSIDLTEYVKLKWIIQNELNATNTDGLSYQLFKGDLSKLTTLERVRLGLVSGQGTVILPRIQDNKQLSEVYIQGTPLATVFNTDSFGNLATNLALTKYSVRFLNTGSATIKAAVDNILSSLRTQKTNGGAINFIHLGEMSAPTGGTSNADYIWLNANGVPTTVGVL